MKIDLANLLERFQRAYMDYNPFRFGLFIGVPNIIKGYHLTINISYQTVKGNFQYDLSESNSFGVISNDKNECYFFDLLNGERFNKEIINLNRSKFFLFQKQTEIKYKELTNIQKIKDFFKGKKGKKIKEIQNREGVFEYYLDDVANLIENQKIKELVKFIVELLQEPIDYQTLYQPLFLMKKDLDLWKYKGSTFYGHYERWEMEDWEKCPAANAIFVEVNPICELSQIGKNIRTDYFPQIVEMEGNFYHLKNIHKSEGFLLFQNGAFAVAKLEEKYLDGKSTKIYNISNRTELFFNKRLIEKLVKEATEEKLNILTNAIETKRQEKRMLIETKEKEIELLENQLQKQVSNQLNKDIHIPLI